MWVDKIISNIHQGIFAVILDSWTVRLFRQEQDSPYPSMLGKTQHWSTLTLNLDSMRRLQCIQTLIQSIHC